MWAAFMDELRDTHLGERRRAKPSAPSVLAQLRAAYGAIVAKRKRSKAGVTSSL
jgi:hypothetical protein